MKTLLPYLISFAGGFLVCLYMTRQGCVETPSETEVLNNVWVEHHPKTIRDTVIITIPKPVVVYKKLKDAPEWLLDSLNRLTEFRDSLLYVDTTDIALNHYSDSIQTPEYKLIWTAETFGWLTSMVTDVSIFSDTFNLKPLPPANLNPVRIVPVGTTPVYKTKNYMIGAGISNLLNYKFSAGYKNWILEAEFDKTHKFNQVYLTKQFSF